MVDYFLEGLNLEPNQCFITKNYSWEISFHLFFVQISCSSLWRLFKVGVLIALETLANVLNILDNFPVSICNTKFCNSIFHICFTYYLLILLKSFCDIINASFSCSYLANIFFISLIISVQHFFLFSHHIIIWKYLVFLFRLYLTHKYQ